MCSCQKQGISKAIAMASASNTSVCRDIPGAAAVCTGAANGTGTSRKENSSETFYAKTSFYARLNRRIVRSWTALKEKNVYAAVMPVMAICKAQGAGMAL